MNLDARSLALSQITHLVTSLNKKNFKTNTNECRSLAHNFGLEAERHLYRTLFSHVDFKQETKNGPSLQQQYLIQVCDNVLFDRPNFVSLICFSVDRVVTCQRNIKPDLQLFSALTKNLKLTPVKELAFTLALTHSSHTDLQTLAKQFFRQKLLCFVDEGKDENDSDTLKELSPAFEVDSSSLGLLHFVLAGLRRVDFADLRPQFISAVKGHFSKSQVPVFIDPHLTDFVDVDPHDCLTGDVDSETKIMMTSSTATSLPEVILDLGYQFTAKPEVCRGHLMRLCGGSSEPVLHAATVARIIGVMVRTHTGLDDSTTLQNMNATGTSLWDKDKNEPKTWNVDVFIKVVHELQPTLHWKEIVLELDHPGFVVKDRQGLILLIKALKLGFQVQGFQGHFPVDMFYRPWKNTDGQISLFQQILRNPDIFNFADYPHHTVAIEFMKVQPDMENREIASWKSLELLDTLLVLAEAGHSMAVLDMFQVPKTHCPDVLTLGLIQINPPLTSFRSDALAQLLQIFLGNHQNSAAILNHAWFSNLNLKVIVVRAMADWYSKAVNEGDSENNRLSRILDVAQDLKALSVLLSAKAVPFVIDLAVMASRRKVNAELEYLNLDKWLNDQIRDHGENFVKAMVQYLQRKLPPLTSGSLPLKEEHLTKANFPIEALHTILVCLQSVAQGAPIQPELKDFILTMVQTSQSLLSRARQPASVPPGALRASRTMDAPQTMSFAPPLSVGPVRPTPRPGISGSNMFSQTGGSGTVGGPMESLHSISSQFAGLNFGSGNQSVPPPPPPSSTSAFSLPGVLGPLVSGPGSPNRNFTGLGAGPPMPPTSMDGSVSPSPFGGQFPPPLPLSTAAGSITTSSGSVGVPSSSGVGSGVMNLAGSGSGSVPSDQSRQGSIGPIFPDSTAPVPREVEDEANSYFQRIYNHPPHPTLSINEVLELLKKFQESSVQKERDVFNCMIKNLFEEYKYFPQYPEKELHITAQLFGGIIEHGLVNMVPLGLALRFVLDAVRKPPESNMYYFGITALDRFKTKLKDYPQYCQHISCIEHFKEFPPHLVVWVEYGVQSQAPPGDPKGDVLPTHLRQLIEKQSQGSANVPSSSGTASTSMGSIVTNPSTQGQQLLQATKATTPVGSTISHTIVRPTVTTVGGRPSIANTTNIDTLLNARQKSGGGEQPKTPSDKIQDKVAFIFNNLSLMNMQQKADELKDILSDDYTGWLAQYLVMKRASIEPNFHTLYSSFLEVLSNHNLYKEVLVETYNNIRILLGSDKSIANFSDRSLLKNLGHWLGLMTLARNKPILMIDLEVKPLIIEAYHNGQQELLYVVPFVAKVLESCAKSKVFKPPCPWTEGIMNLLAELHQEHDLKLNLKFEIEVLCKNLNLELNQLAPGTLLKDYDKLNRMLNFNNFGMKHHHHHHHHPQQHLGQSSGTAPVASAAATAKTGLETFPSMNSTSAHIPPGANVPAAVSVATGSHVAARNVPTSTVSSVGMDVSSGMPLGRGSMQMLPVAHTSVASQQPPQPLTSMSMNVPASHVPEGHLAPVNEVLLSHQQAGGTPPAPAAPAIRPTEPKFHFTDISTSNLNAIVPHIQIDNRISLLKDQPELLQLIKIAIEKSIQEWMTPVVERSIKISLTSCEQILKKDFALDHDENRMRTASHNMVRNLTSGMAMITCRDHLLLSIKNNLKNLMVTLMRNLTPQQQDTIEMTVTVVANDNVELACAFIQKKAVERAIPEIDKKLKGEYESRIIARKESRHHFDADVLAYQSEMIPEKIRLKVGGVTSAQSAVYEEFGRNIPGFKPLTDREVDDLAPKPLSTDMAVPSGITHGNTNVLATSDECVAILDEVISKVDHFVKNCTGLPTTPHMNNLHALLDGMTIARNVKDPSAIMILVETAVRNLLQGLTIQAQVDTESLARYRDANLLVLRAISDPRAYGQTWTNNRVTRALIEAPEDIRYNVDAFVCLMRPGLINLFEYDKHLAAAMSNGDNSSAIKFAMMICQIYLIEDRSNAQIIEADLFGTIEVLQKIATQSQHPPEGISNLMEMIKMSSERLEQNLAMSGPTGQLHSGIQQAREFEDPPGLLEKTEYLLREWVNAYHSRDAGRDSRQAFIVFVQLMNQHGILKTDDLITRFFRISTQRCVNLCYRALGEVSNSPTLVRAKCFHTLDAYVRLITLLVKHSGETQNTVTKVNLLNKVLGIVAGVLLIDHDMRSTDFQQVPYHRIFIMLFLELNTPDQILENINFQVLQAYCNMLHLLRPAKAPGFAYAWLEIVSHRVFLGRILASTPAQKGWPMYSQLLVDLFKFLSPFLRNAELAKPVQRLYRGTLRVLLVLLHDFPEFLCDYHYGFCDVIPPNCIQMRNLILSAFPRNMRLPDPFTPNLKVEMLPEISIAPRTVSNYAAMIKPNFKKELDSYLKNRSPVSFLSEVRGNLLIGAGEQPGNRYNIQLINAVVMHVGTSAIQFIRSKGHTPNMSTIAHSSHMDIFQNLAADLETEGRYLFLNCIANQLRYPNSHTHYFSCTLLYLFAEANTEAIQEQITRVLLERLIVNRPHPWGLLITFIELIKNPSFHFWQHEFVTCAPEIQKLFESVARSCMVQTVPHRNANDQD